MVEGEAAVERHPDADQSPQALHVLVLGRAQSCELLEALVFGLEDVRVVQRDYGLGGEGLENLGVAVVEVPVLPRVKGENRSQRGVAVIKGCDDDLAAA